jgi:catecholate siderophore receptor
MSKLYIQSKPLTCPRLLNPSSISSALVLASSMAFAQEPTAVKDKKLDAVKVHDTSAEPSYKADKVSSPKFTQPLVDTPQTIVVVKKELFEQQAATTLSETLRNTPGITMLMGENGNTATGDSIFMRGFDTQGSIFVDGIRDLGSITRDVFNTEQVEIAKGPAGVDNGRGAAAGYVNLSSKRANLEDAKNGNITLGTADFKRATFDVNQSFGKDSAGRVNLVKQDSGIDGRDEVEYNLQGLATSVGFGLSGKTRTFVNLFALEQSGIPDGGVTTLGLDGYYNAIFDPRPNGGSAATPTAPAVPPAPGVLAGTRPQAVDSSNFYGSRSDKNDVSANMLTVIIEHDLAEQTTVRNSSRYGRTEQDQVLTGVNALTFPTATVTNPDTWTVARSRQGKDQVNEILTNQTNLKTAFETWGIGHELATGIEFVYESQNSWTLGTPWPSATATTRVAQVNANVYNPSLADEFQPVVRDGSKIYGQTTTQAFYGLDTLTLNPQWELSAGLRVEHFDTTTDRLVRQSTATSATQPIPVGTMLGQSAEASDDLISWKLGAVFKPVDIASVYLSYATSQLPPGSTNFQLITDTTASLNANSPNIDPQKGTNLELGTKWNLLEEKLSFTAAVFKSTNENEIATQPDGTSQAVGEREVSGVEFGLNGIITQGWQINVGLALMDPKITHGNRSNATNGSTQTDGGSIQWSPESTFTLWTSYAFDFGLTLAGGVRYVDSMLSSSLTNAEAQSRRSMLEIPDYTIFDAAASYKLTPNLSLQLNLLNLTDEDYIATVNNAGSRYYPGAPQSAKLGLNFTY